MSIRHDGQEYEDFLEAYGLGTAEYALDSELRK